MATDPVTAPFSNTGRWIFAISIGSLAVLTRIGNPAYPESMMLVILFMNVLAPLIDHFVVRANQRRRAKRRAAT
jgi:Na+-transporting NADH:ubiquinone oxidoreductase subunit B